MSVQMIRSLSVIFGIVSIGLLLVSILLFFVLKIPRTIGDLTGANARKSIENIRKRNSTENEQKDVRRYNSIQYTEELVQQSDQTTLLNQTDSTFTDTSNLIPKQEEPVFVVEQECGFQESNKIIE